MNLDKPLPTSLEEERLVLGAIMAKGIDGYAEVADSISASSFYFSANRHIFAAIEEAVKRGVDCDLTVVQTILRERNLLDEVGGPLYLTDSLTCALPSSLTFHALELNNLCARRELILRSAKITESAYDTSNKLEDVLDEAQKAITAVTAARILEPPKPIANDFPAVLKAIEETQLSGARPGLSYGFEGLDEILHGMKPGYLVTVGARPGIGKSAFAAYVGKTAAQEGKVVGYFSYEMDKDQLLRRLVAADSEVSHSKLCVGGMSTQEYDHILRSSSRLSELPFYIFETPGQRVRDLAASIRRLKVQAGSVDLVIIDHFHLMTPTSNQGNEAAQLGEMSREIKNMALALKVPVMLLCQLNRELENRDDKRPKLKDLRGSGSLEQDSDVNLMLHREEKYDLETIDKGIMEILIRKNRHGAEGFTSVLFRQDTTGFYERPRPRYAA